MFKDKEKQREYQREQMRKRRAVIPIENVIPEAPVIPKDVIPSVIPVQLSPTDPYDHDKAVEHMMSMHPVFSPFTKTTPNGISYHPLEGWIQGEPYRHTPFVIQYDAGKRARLKKVVESLSPEKVKVR